MKLLDQAWEADDGTLHKTQEMAQRSEHVTRMERNLVDWSRTSGAGSIVGIFARDIALYLYDRGARFEAPSMADQSSKAA